MQTKQPTTKVLLNILAATGNGAVEFYAMLHDLKFHRGTYLRGGHGYVKELQQLRDERRARLILKRLRERGYVQAEKIGRRLMVTLTTKGRQATLAAKLRQAPPLSDKLYTIVIFDIPESERRARQQFRLLLRQGGFTKLQQSVWISQTDTYQTLAEFARHLKIEPWVNLFYARNLLHIPKTFKPSRV